MNEPVKFPVFVVMRNGHIMPPGIHIHRANAEATATKEEGEVVPLAPPLPSYKLRGLVRMVELADEVTRLEQSRPKLWNTHPAKLAFNRAAVAAIPEIRALLSQEPSSGEATAVIPRELPPGDFANFGAIIVSGADPYRIWKSVVALGERKTGCVSVASPVTDGEKNQGDKK